MENKELIEKCRLTDEELERVSGEAAYRRNLPNMTPGQSYVKRIADTATAKAIPLISAEARKKE